MLLFTAFNSADNLAAKVLREDGYKELGFYSMASLYLVFAITGFTSKALVNKLKTPTLGYRIPLFIGGICYFFRILCFLLPATYGSSYHTLTSVLILVTAALNGFGAGLLWVAQSAYVTSCATASTKGFYFSYFFVIFMVSQIVGNLVAAFLLRYQGQALYYLVMAVLSASGCCMFWVLKAPREEIIDSVRSSGKRIQGGSTILVISRSSKKESENVLSGSGNEGAEAQDDIPVVASEEITEE